MSHEGKRALFLTYGLPSSLDRLIFLNNERIARKLFPERQVVLVRDADVVMPIRQFMACACARNKYGL